MWPPQPEIKGQIVEGLDAVLLRINTLTPTLEASESKRTEAHPRLGGLQLSDTYS
ncbi:hypothetical protein ACFQZR_13765 [Paenibacillus sp. GCM10027629]|uniref:hypothetical protein n=1 Tax=Paenibacillus sp. GCM10027629 TaxID=3273414 RepID=UPI003643349D